jgi:hypothetical protein
MKFINLTRRLNRLGKSTLAATMLALFFLSCQEPEQVPVEPPEDFSTKLGSKNENPYSLEIMTQAIANVSAKKPNAGRTKVLAPSTTHNYVRFAPQDENQLITLHDYGYDLYDVPLDQDLEYQGEYYQDPSLPASAITYQYTLVPDNYALPTTVPYATLGKVFLFNDDAGDEKDPEPEPDPWTPDPPPGGGEYCYDEYNQAYVCGTKPRRYLRMKSQPGTTEDLYQKATRELIEAGLSPRDVYNEAMRLAGFPGDVIETSNNGRTQRYYASGYVKVADNSNNRIDPVRNIRVKVRRFFKIDEAQTDNSGYFYIDKGYRQKASVILKFTNNRGTVRAISGALKVWEYAQVLEKEVGQFEQAAMQGMTITLPYNANADTYAALQWAGAHALNTLQLMYDFSAANSLQAPYPNLNIWISSAITQAASAPMLRGIANTSQLSIALNYLLPTTASTIKQIVQRWLPDVTMRLQGSNGLTKTASQVNGTFFHEFGHSQHYAAVGNTYWDSYIWYIVANAGYGTRNTSGAGLVAVGEAWGFYIGPTFTRTKYAGTASIAQAELNFLEFQKRNDNVSVQGFNGSFSEGWIPWGLLHDMTDSTEPSITLINDQVNGYTMSGMFRGYRTGATTVPALRDGILSNNGFSQSLQVNNLAASYGW